MAKDTPGENMQKLEQTQTALEALAPDATFGGLTLAQYKTKVKRSSDTRGRVAEADAARVEAVDDRIDADEDALAARTLIINGIIGDPNFGPDSALYEACGFVRKSDRKSGLTRKKKTDANKS